jgi:hypothetical protein
VPFVPVPFPPFVPVFPLKLPPVVPLFTELVPGVPEPVVAVSVKPVVAVVPVPAEVLSDVEVSDIVDEVSV